MLNRRWWDLAAIAAVAVVAVITLLEPPYGTPDIASWAASGAFLVAYVVYFRGRLGSVDSRHHLAITAVMAVLLMTGTAFDSTFTVLQTFAYPYIWVTAPSPRRAVISNVVLAVAVAVGYTIHLGVEGLLLGIGIAGLSFAFSLALGLWITHIAEVGEENGRLLEELRAAQGELAAMHRDAGVSDERARIAREVHDTIAQSLTGLVMVAQRAGNRLDAAGAAASAAAASGTGPSAAGNAGPGASDAFAPARQDLALIEELARDALTEARGLVAALAPVSLDTSLADALRRLGSGFERETGVVVSVEVAAGGLGRELDVLLLRSAQEGLANVRKHARAQHAWVEVDATDGAARLTVRDDGVGPGDARPGDRGFGLTGLRDRLAVAGGSVAFGPAEGGGTLLRVDVPLPAADASGFRDASDAPDAPVADASGSRDATEDA